MRRVWALVGLVVLIGTACGKDKATTSSTATTVAKGEAVTVQVDNRSKDINFEATEYFPKAATVAPGTELKFHSNFLGEPHTVTFGSSIDKLMTIYNSLSDEEKNSDAPPPQEVQDLKVPFVFPDDADFSDLSAVKLNQSATQPCFLAAGQFAPGADPCPKATAPQFDGTQPFYNSGILKDDEVFDVQLADGLPPGVYQYICLFHGPEMGGQITVAGTGAQSAADVQAAGDKQLADEVAIIKPEVTKAQAATTPGEVKAGVGSEQVQSAIANLFAPKEISVPVGGSVTWNLSFHTVSFNAPEDARPAFVQGSDGSWKFNAKALTPVGYTPPAPPDDSSGGGGPPSSDEPPPPVNVDGGTWDGTGFFSSGSIDSPGDVFFKLTFSKAGTYKYLCLIHTDMEGTVKVG